MKTSIDKKRFKKILKRRKLAAHKRRVGPENYYADRLFALCAGCGEFQKMCHMTPVGGGVGIGACMFCIEKLGKEKKDGEKIEE